MHFIILAEYFVRRWKKDFDIGGKIFFYRFFFHWFILYGNCRINLLFNLRQILGLQKNIYI